ncbi:heat shock protein beta-6-like [Sitodiplosis mosellana]|uniref:heat shock protein beta-6-like n=1 Tax=Sitodiplosis mosellana TaxID=263140 RepID=UPI002444FB99|nr:heat shock protein beta-6-like [Sitodiplosis mosellana]
MSAVSPYGAVIPQVGPSAPDNFEVLIDAKHFDPREISIKVNGNIIFIDAEHVQQQPGWPVKYIKRSIHRQFNLPPGFDGANIVSGITPDGILSVRCRAANSTGHYPVPTRY